MNTNGAQESFDAVWRLKEINYPPKSQNLFKIVTQNRNGPCSLIALVNILVLRQAIKILPDDRHYVSYEYLASLVADYLVNSHHGLSETDLNAALAVLPSTQKGMDLNPQFTGISSFSDSSDKGELTLFELCSVVLVHGWLVDPCSSEYPIIAKAGDYDAALNLIVAGEVGIQSRDADHNEDTQYRDAVVIRHFLESNSTQLTYRGLFSLLNIEPGLYAFIRNSHLSVLLRHTGPNSESSLWTLVTDSNFSREPEVVWESLEDVDGSSSRFVNGDLVFSSTVGGDFAGTTAESVLREIAGAGDEVGYNSDVKLAVRLQAEEDERARYAQRLDLHNRSSRQPMTSVPARTPGSEDPRGPYPHAPSHKHLQPIDISADLALHAENTIPPSKSSLRRHKHVPKPSTEKRRDCVIM